MQDIVLGLRTAISSKSGTIIFILAVFVFLCIISYLISLNDFFKNNAVYLSLIVGVIANLVWFFIYTIYKDIIFLTSRESMLDRESHIFDQLVKDGKASEIENSNELEKRLTAERIVADHSIHVMPLNLQTLRYYSVRAGKQWVDSERVTAKKGVVNRIFLHDFDENKNVYVSKVSEDDRTVEEVEMNAVEAAKIITNALQDNTNSVMVPAEELRKKGFVIRDYGVFFQSGKIPKGFFSFKDREQRFTKMLSNHYETSDADYLKKIDVEFKKMYEYILNDSTYENKNLRKW